MTTMNISVSDEKKAFVETQMAQEGYASASEYLRALIRDARKRRAKQDLEARRPEGKQSPVIVMDRDDWDSIEWAGRRSVRPGGDYEPRAISTGPSFPAPEILVPASGAWTLAGPGAGPSSRRRPGAYAIRESWDDGIRGVQICEARSHSPASACSARPSGRVPRRPGCRFVEAGRAVGEAARGRGCPAARLRGGASRALPLQHEGADGGALRGPPRRVRPRPHPGRGLCRLLPVPREDEVRAYVCQFLQPAQGRRRRRSSPARTACRSASGGSAAG